MLQEPSHSPYDLRFRLLGFPIRIAWGFWLMAIVFGYSWVQGLDLMLRDLSPGIMPLLALWTLCIFVSILIHELGHALAFRQNHIDAEIVLYHFGGLAIPRGGSRYATLGPQQTLWISFAGPLMQFASALIVIALVKMSGFRLDQFDTIIRLPEGILRLIGASEGESMITQSVGLYALIDFYLFPSVFWAILNLVPVLPLDGGQITRSIVEMRGGTAQTALWISVIAAAIVALYGFSGGQQYMGIMFMILGITSFQQLQQMNGRF
ncbi:Peptidase family M50 [Rubripirellula tenax]|uniref:Peptidase family M50 n=1 Tax=Rubripirellula tenax TaxID=2528015 RepID=A0A5C6FCV6_9BACT|nr:site-2 protease family protein [Rubripirellula tenax]TWU58467.1 Peptidase family M50 [Rubripirellula tenax]